MKSIANGIRNIRARLPQRTASNAHDVYTVLVQGLTVLRIAALVLVLYIRFKLEHLVDRRRD